MTITEVREDGFTDMDRAATRALDNLETVVGDVHAESELLIELAGCVRVMDQLAPAVYTDDEVDLITEQQQYRRVADLLADLAQARALGMPRIADRIPELENDPEAVAVLDALAAPGLPITRDRADVYDRLGELLDHHGHNGDLARAVAEAHRRHWAKADEDRVVVVDLVGTTVLVVAMLIMGVWALVHGDEAVRRVAGGVALAAVGFYGNSLVWMYGIVWQRFREHRRGRSGLGR